MIHNGHVIAWAQAQHDHWHPRHVAACVARELTKGAAEFLYSADGAMFSPSYWAGFYAGVIEIERASQ